MIKSAAGIVAISMESLPISFKPCLLSQVRLIFANKPSLLCVNTLSLLLIDKLTVLLFSGSTSDTLTAFDPLYWVNAPLATLNTPDDAFLMIVVPSILTATSNPPSVPSVILTVLSFEVTSPRATVILPLFWLTLVTNDLATALSVRLRSAILLSVYFLAPVIVLEVLVSPVEPIKSFLALSIAFLRLPSPVPPILSNSFCTSAGIASASKTNGLFTVESSVVKPISTLILSPSLYLLITISPSFAFFNAFSNAVLAAVRSVPIVLFLYKHKCLVAIL